MSKIPDQFYGLKMDALLNIVMREGGINGTQTIEQALEVIYIIDKHQSEAIQAAKDALKAYNEVKSLEVNPKKESK